MTTCLVVICRSLDDQPAIVATADRMITAGDVQFEWDIPKAQLFDFPTTHRPDAIQSDIPVLALNAGSALDHAELVRRVTLELKSQVSKVSELAELFALVFAGLRRDRAVRMHLVPLGLDAVTFIQNQQAMQPAEASRLAWALANEALHDELIIAGIDDSGAHIYLVRDPGIAECHDYVGFAAIGSGSRHAEAAFMTGAYSRTTSFARAALQAYVAKKRSEVAPGVGSVTDLWWMEKSFGTFVVSPDLVDAIFAKYYKRILKGESGVRARSEASIERSFREVFQESSSSSNVGTEGSPPT